MIIAVARGPGGCDPIGESWKSHFSATARSNSLDSTVRLHSAGPSIANPHTADESSNLDASYSGFPVDTNIRRSRNNRGPARWGEPVSRGDAAAGRCEFPRRIARNQSPRSIGRAANSFFSISKSPLSLRRDCGYYVHAAIHERKLLTRHEGGAVRRKRLEEGRSGGGWSLGHWHKNILLNHWC